MEPLPPSVAYVLLRCKRLREYGLLVQRKGFFVLTDTGERYLDGDLDAVGLIADGDHPDTDPAVADRPPRDDAPADG